MTVPLHQAHGSIWLGFRLWRLWRARVSSLRGWKRALQTSWLRLWSVASSEGSTLQMSHGKLITVTFGDEKRTFKKNALHSSVLNSMARMFLPRGVLLRAGDNGHAELGPVVLSQEEVLSQTEYVYQHPCLISTRSAGFDVRLLNSILRLEIVQRKVVTCYGTAVVFSREGLCLTANHCLEAAGVTSRTRSLRVSGHVAEVVVRNEALDIACLRITDGDGSGFDFIPFGYEMAAAMNVHLLSFPIMVDDDFVVQSPTITHGQVSCILSPQQVLADYACFANSSGGAVVCDNKLVGIHTEALYGEEDGKERAMRNNTDRIQWLEANSRQKNSLGLFVSIWSIHGFLVSNGVITNPRIQQASSSCQSGRTVMVRSKQSAKKPRRNSLA